MSTQVEVATDSGGVEAVRERLRREGALARPLRHVFTLLTRQPHSLSELVRICRTPRRTVEELIRLAGEDVEHGPDGYRLRDSVHELYRQHVRLDVPEPARTDEEVERLLRDFVATGPAPCAALDHVTATPGTALRRAAWLRDNYDLSRAHLLLLGDHDLTSLASCLLVPELRVTVVDLDERILAHIDGIAAEYRLPVHTVHADLRFGLPPALVDGFELVFSDPPYTPEGIGLFTARAAEAMADGNSRLLLAYGFSPRTPALGHKVQQELLRLGMVFESIVSGFNEYHGAEAIGGTSALYVCQPTGRAHKSTGERQAIYTHGPQSLESGGEPPGPEFLRAIGETLGTEVGELRSPGWQRPLRTAGAVPVFDLRADPGPWLLRTLLACNADRAGFLVPNRHPDITSEHAQNSLLRLVGAKYELRFQRGKPDANHALVVADRNKHGGGVAGHLSHRAHGKIGNIWREALIANSDTPLTKREAREHVEALVADSADLGLRLIDLPRHRLDALLHTEAGQ
ncbi:putative methyltransferase [Actinopolyspora erythraea]|uniref:Methyltransferase n=1 Tax=Actinopolyspora erythraea TaxID=414996 RepID=A0A099D232_9ACTN|nr:bis-aminopropyl spermidine synthase family protein [Actinopolyspora erythraea]ASU77688.1 putative methyltransferase [Actinopolyspora erythraea]KGI80079.1 methyltransferase [Actinopolyspora erythraea]